MEEPKPIAINLGNKTLAETLTGLELATKIAGLDWLALKDIKPGKIIPVDDLTSVVFPPVAQLLYLVISKDETVAATDNPRLAEMLAKGVEDGLVVKMPVEEIPLPIKMKQCHAWIVEEA